MRTREELEKGFQLGDWEVIPARRILKRGDEEIEPEPKVFGCLMSLALRDGDAVSRDDLIDEVWDGRLTSDDAVTRCIKELRGHLGDKRPFRYVKALTGVGYRLLVRVEPFEPAPASETERVVVEAPAPVSYKKRFITLLVVTAAILAWIFWPSPPAANGVRIGVLPFVNASGNPEHGHLVAGFKTQLIETLHSAPNLRVINGRVAYPDDSVIEIARKLDVDNVLTGEVQALGGDLKVTYELASGETGEILASDSVTGSIERHFELQVELANRVRAQLFGEASRHLVSASRPSNFDAYNAYLRGMYAFERRFNAQNLEDAMALFEETISLDPDFGPAYLQLATGHALLPAYRGADPAQSHARAIETVERGIAVDASIEQAASAVYGFVYHQQKDWAKAELAYEQATRAEIIDSNAFNWYSRMLASVGRLEASRDVALIAWQLDPDNAVINTRVAVAYSWLGDSHNAERFFERSRRLGAAGTTHLMAHALFLSREGRIDESSEVAKIAANNAGLPLEWIDAALSGVQDPANQDAAIAAIDQASADGKMPANVEIVVRTLLGDHDGAMAIARRLEEPGEYFEMDLLWIPEFAPLRQREDFRELMDNLGITEYWQLKNCEWREVQVSCAER